MIGRRGKEREIRLAVCARETDILAFIEKMAATQFYFICASLPIQGFSCYHLKVSGNRRLGWVTLGYVRLRALCLAPLSVS